MTQHSHPNNPLEDRRKMQYERYELDERDPVLEALAEELETVLAVVPARDERRARANRSAFLTAAARQFAPRPSPMHRLWRRMLMQVATLLLFMSVSWLSVRVASAGSLPGDNLYPFKLTMERVEVLFYGEERWERRAQSRRLEEVMTLVESGRVAQVDFEGTLQRGNDGQWYIDQVPITFAPEQQALMQRMCGPVRVQGVVANGQLQVAYLTPSCLSLDSSPSQAAESPLPTPLILPAAPDDSSGEPLGAPATT